MKDDRVFQLYLALIVAPNYKGDDFDDVARMAFKARDAFEREERRRETGARKGRR